MPLMSRIELLVAIVLGSIGGGSVASAFARASGSPADLPSIIAGAWLGFVTLSACLLIKNIKARRQDAD